MSCARSRGGPARFRRRRRRRRDRRGQRPARRADRLRAWLGTRQTRGSPVGIIVALAAFCYLGPLFYRTNQVTVELNIATLPPGARYPLGTDGYGYDVLGRLMVGGQSSLELGFAVASPPRSSARSTGRSPAWRAGSSTR